MKRMFAGYGYQLYDARFLSRMSRGGGRRKDFRANAIKKALAVSKFTGYPAVADDSGLEVKPWAVPRGFFRTVCRR